MITRLKESFNARVVYPLKSDHFDRTREGRRLRYFYNIHKGKRCFFIGNGPSLKAEDLTQIYKSGDITFGFNRIYNIFDSTPWRPSYYISQDEKILQGCADVVDGLELPVKFIPMSMNWYYGISIKDASWFMMKPPREKQYKPLDFSDEIDKQVYQGGTGMYTAAQIAAYMGIETIYFIGVDHQFRTSVNNKGEIITDTSVKDYFSDSYNPDKDNLYIPNTEKSTYTYIALKEQCDLRGIKVYNATRGGKLEVFPRVTFDELF